MMSSKPSASRVVIPPHFSHHVVNNQVLYDSKSILATSGREEAIRICREKVRKIAAECERSNTKYHDRHFDVGNQSDLCVLPASELLKCLKDEPFDIKRPTGGSARVEEIFDNPSFFVDGVDPQDIQQGRLGDCWFLAAIATVVNIPGLIESLCVERNEKAGVYGFIFFRDGEWVSEVVDDRLFLCNPEYHMASPELKMAFKSEKKYNNAMRHGSDALHYAKCNESNETWLPLLEKAYAKAHGDFGSLEGGLTGEGVEDLTGGVTTFQRCDNIMDKDRFWLELQSVNQEFLYAFSRLKGGSEERNEETGILSRHAYSLIDAVEAKGKRLVKIRNPWGNSEWLGPWSDGSSEWTPEWMQILNHRFGDDGAFWMTLEDCITVFDSFERTRIFSPSWSVSQLWTICEGQVARQFQPQEFRFKTQQSGPVVIVLQQADTRYFSGLEGSFTFKLEFTIRQEGESEAYARSPFSPYSTRNTNVELNLPAGSWIVNFRVIRGDNSGPSRREFYQYTQMFKKSFFREKLLTTARSYDFIRAKCISEDEMDALEDRIANMINDSEGAQQQQGESEAEESATCKDTDAEAREPEDEEHPGNEEGTSPQGEEVEQEQQPQQAEEEEDDLLDAEAMIGLRIYSFQQNVDLVLAPADLTELEGMDDPDQTYVQSFLLSDSAKRRSSFLASMSFSN